MNGRIYWLISQGPFQMMHDVHGAVDKFYQTNKIKPSHIKMCSRDMAMFLSALSYQPVVPLEEDKKYANYVITPCGPVKLECFSDEDDQIVAANGTNIGSVIMVENTDVDKEFEKHVLNEDK